jgi:DeoR family transcriptional regulator, fructose operon transcriptional repressor
MSTGTGVEQHHTNNETNETNISTARDERRPMYAEERHEAITGLVLQQGRVVVSDVAATLGVTTETVRRDLAQLERAGVLRRVHGGAVPTSGLASTEPLLADRDSAHAEQKDRIAKAAVDLVPAAGGSVLLDAGTTTSRLAALLPTDRQLLVITHAVPLAARLAGVPGISLQLLGGSVRGTTQAAVGPDTVQALSDLRADVAFVGTNALMPGHGLSTPNADEAAVKRALVRAGRQVVVLADSSKLSREHLIRFAPLSAVDVLVTDDGIDDDTLRALEADGIEVLVA